MVILSTTDLASKPRSGNAGSDHTTSQIPWTARSAGVLSTVRRSSTFYRPNDCCHRRLARTKQIHGHKKQKSMPAGPRIGSERHQRTNEPCASHGAVTKLSRWTRPSSLAVKFAFKWRILNVLCLSEMNYAEKRLGIPTKCYFQLQSRREFGFM